MSELPCCSARPRDLVPETTRDHSCEALWGRLQEDTARRVRLRKAASSLVMADEQRGGGQQNNELLAMQRASKKAATAGGDRPDRRQDKQPPANPPDGPDLVRHEPLVSPAGPCVVSYSSTAAPLSGHSQGSHAVGTAPCCPQHWWPPRCK